MADVDRYAQPFDALQARQGGETLEASGQPGEVLSDGPAADVPETTTPVEPRRFRGSRPRAGRHQAGTTAPATERADEPRDAAIDGAAAAEDELAVVDAVAEQPTGDEQAEIDAEYDRRLQLTEDRIEEWVDDSNVQWKIDTTKDHKEYYVTLQTPTDDKSGIIHSRISVIDHNDGSRWYVMNMRQDRSAMSVYWKQGAEQAFTRRHRREPIGSSLGDLGLAVKVTDLEQSHLDQYKGQAAAEESPRVSRTAQLIGRLLGDKTVTKWR
jgi:hypothetical protein